MLVSVLMIYLVISIIMILQILTLTFAHSFFKCKYNLTQCYEERLPTWHGKHKWVFESRIDLMYYLLCHDGKGSAQHGVH